MPYTLTPDTLIRIEDAKDSTRGFLLVPWPDVRDRIPCSKEPFYKRILETDGAVTFEGFRLIHPDAIQEI